MPVLDDDDRCEMSDLPRATCAHCGARPGTAAHLEDPRPATTGRDLFASAPMPADPGKPLKLAKQPPAGECACGQPTRDNAYGCDDCAGELSRFIATIPWLVEQLDITIVRDRAKRPGGGDTELMWNDHASRARRRLVALLVKAVRLCQVARVAHQSPDDTTPPTTPPDLEAISRWLLWRVDGLLHVQVFPHLLRACMQTERAIMGAIDCGPDLIYLGVCTKDTDGEPCNGSVYAVLGEPNGNCQACRATWATDPSRENLYRELDSMLCSAAEIARLSTYLGVPATRDQVRKLVNQWHTRGRLAARGHDASENPLFLYSEVRTLLSATYERKGA